MNKKSEPYIQLAGTVTIGPKGQVVIPVDVRDKMSIQPGDRLVALYVPGKKSVAFVREDRVQHLIDKMEAHIATLHSQLEEKTTKRE